MSSKKPTRQVVLPEELAGIDSEELLTATCYASLKCFITEAWSIVVPGEPFQDNKHIDALCYHLEALARIEIQDLLITMPPRLLKSTVSSIMFPAWLWMEEPPGEGDCGWTKTMRGPHLRMLYSSYAQTLATRDSLATRRLIEHPWYRERWGWGFSITTDQNEKMRFENDKKGYRLATSVGGANTGEGGDIIACDDPHNVQAVESDTVRRGGVRWWNEVMSTRKNNPKTARRLVILQRSHEEDLAGDILARGGYCHLNLPMEFERKFSIPTTIGWKDWRTKDNELLFPSRIGPKELETIKLDLGPYASAGQLQQRPAPLEGGLFKRDKWRTYRTSPDSIAQAFDDACLSFDFAFKGKEDSDFVAGGAVVRKGADFYVLQVVNDRLTFRGSKALTQTLAARWPMIHSKLVEDKANGPAIIDDLQSVVGGLIAVDPEGGKEARAAVVEPYQAAGNIYLDGNAAWTEPFIEQHRVFPNGANDDMVDFLSQAICWLLKRMHKKSGGSVVSVLRTTSSIGPEPFYDPRYA